MKLYYKENCWDGLKLYEYDGTSNNKINNDKLYEFRK